MKRDTSNVHLKHQYRQVSNLVLKLTRRDSKDKAASILLIVY